MTTETITLAQIGQAYIAADHALTDLNAARARYDRRPTPTNDARVQQAGAAEQQARSERNRLVLAFGLVRGHHAIIAAYAA